MFVNQVPAFKKKYVLLTTIAAVAMASAAFAASKSDTAATKETTVSKATEVVKQAQIDTSSKPTAKSSVTKETTDIEFPYHRDGVDKEVIDVRFKVKYEKGQTAFFHMVGDDCVDKIEVNDEEVKLTGTALAQRCNWNEGFDIDLKPFLNKGSNKVHVVVRNIAGWVGFHIVPIESIPVAAAKKTSEKK